MLKKKALASLLLWLPLLTSTPVTPPTKKLAIPNQKNTPQPKKTVTFVRPQPKPQPTIPGALATSITQTDQNLPLITVFNTASANNSNSIVIKANCRQKGFGNVDQHFTKILGTVTNPNDNVIAPLNVEVLQVPAGTVELWAESKTPFDTVLHTKTIPFDLQQNVCAFVFSIIDGKPNLESIPFLAPNTLYFYNQTSNDYTLSFFTSSNDIFSYLSGQLSFLIPAGQIVTLPAPTNAKKFSIGNVSLSPVPGTKTVFLLTPKTTFGKEDPVVTQLQIKTV